MPCVRQAWNPHPTGGIWTCERGRLLAVRKMAALPPPFLLSSLYFPFLCPAGAVTCSLFLVHLQHSCACLHVWGVRFFHSLKVIRSGQFPPESLKASRESGKITLTLSLTPAVLAESEMAKGFCLEGRLLAWGGAQ